MKYKVVSAQNKSFEYFRGSYNECKEWAMAHFHTHGYMDILPI